MLKFLRKYQKWMLVVFCGGLMVAFLIPQAASQFAPNPATRSRGTTYGDNPITMKDMQRSAGDLQLLQILGVEPIPSLSIVPNTGNEERDAMHWVLIQRAADHNKLGASRQEAFQLVASAVGAEDIDALDKIANERFNASAGYLIEIGKQYLKAEQLRQLLAGIEYTKPTGTDNPTGSPGLQRLYANAEATQFIQAITQNNPQALFQAAAMRGMTPDQFIINLLFQQGLLARIAGHERVTADQLRYAMQRQFTELDLTVVVLDAEDRLETTSVDDAFVQGIFERFADDAPGTGTPYGLGYREPDRVTLEALRIPIDAVRDSIKVSQEDIRAFYNERKGELFEETEPGEVPRTAELTPELRDEIYTILKQVRADKKAIEIAQEVRLRLNEDARGLPDDGPFKKLPEDFKPTPLVEIAGEIEKQHGFMPEVILIDDFVSGQAINEGGRFTQAWVSQMPTSTLRMPIDHPQFNFLQDQKISETVLSGKAGLFASYAPEVGNRGMVIGDYVRFAKPFIDDIESPDADLGLQPGLPGRYLLDLTRSTYVFRIVEARPSQPPADMTAIAEQVLEDAKKVKAYEDLAAEQEALVKRAAEQSITNLVGDEESKKTLTALTRQAIRGGGGSLDGVRSTGPIVERAFAVADDLTAGEGVEAASEADRIFAVELAGDYKLAVVRLDNYRPMSRSRFEQVADSPTALMQAATDDAAQGLDSPMSIEALMRYTAFEWADGFSDAVFNAGDDGAEESEEDDAESEDE